MDGCIVAALGQADPTGSYVEPGTYASIQREKRRPPAAIGLEMPARKRYGDPLTVVSPIRDGPAARAGIRAGDLIEAVDGVAVRPLAQDDVVDLLRGPVGSRATVTIRRGDQELEAIVERDVVAARSVRTDLLAGGLLYVRINRFRADATAGELASILASRLDAGTPPRGWVLDLRFNPGGPVSEVAAVASLFVPDGKPVFGVLKRSGVEMHASKPVGGEAAARRRVAKLEALPLVVLVDGGTGGGAEVLAHLLRERFKAPVVGEPTACFDAVLESFDLRGRASVRLTTGFMVPPSGSRAYDRGVPLDEVVANVPGIEYGDPREDRPLSAALKRLAR